MDQKIIIIAGPTASGKSQLALTLAKEKPSVIINADSMQVYREIPVLSAQPEAAEIPHRLYGCISAREEFSTGRWLELAKMEIDEALASGVRPIIVGGTGLYIKSLVKGIAEIPDIAPEIRLEMREKLEEIGKEKFHEYLLNLDPEMRTYLGISDRHRMLRAAEVMRQTGRSILYWRSQTKPLFPRESFEISLVLPERAELYRRCDSRFLQMLENGALREVENLKKMQLPENSMALKALGVRELSAYLGGEISFEEAIQKAQQSTRNYAKRQYTWFRNQAL